MIAQGLQQRQSQTIAIAPYMRQSLKILQVTAQELRAEVLKELEINPVLEENPATEFGSLDTDDDFSESIYEEDRLNSFEQAYGTERSGAESNERKQALMDSIVGEDSLEDYLMSQIRFIQLSDQEREGLVFLIGSLDDNGFLTSTASEIAHLLNLAPSVVEKMLTILQSLEPTGIGARDLRESLLIQLRKMELPSPLALRIVENHYDLLMRHRVPELTKALGVKATAVHEALETIATLDPAPARRFSEDSNRAITADVHIEPDTNATLGWRVRLENAYIPRLHISEKYRNLLESGKLSLQERDYIREKLQSAKQLIRAIDERQGTIAKIATVILEQQCAFFEAGINALKPLTLQQVADLAELHEATVSRALMGKYLACPRGIYPFKYFFSTGYDQGFEQESISSTTVRERVREFILSEDSEKPLSDQAIANLFAQKYGLTIARRTIAKYREGLGILPTHLRKVHR
jgi:RNA polymerase sigma-54 factor